MTGKAIPGQEKSLSKGGNMQQAGTGGPENRTLGGIEKVSGRQRWEVVNVLPQRQQPGNVQNHFYVMQIYRYKRLLCKVSHWEFNQETRSLVACYDLC